MQSKTIKSILSKKLNDWSKSIKDENLRSLVEKNSIITGGAITSMLLQEKVKDFDVYFKDKETTKKIAEYYVDLFNKNKGKITNKIDYKNKAFVLDGSGDLEEQLEKANMPVMNGKRAWNSHMLKIEKDRIKIIIRSDGVASMDDTHLEEPFEDAVEVIERADDIPSNKLEDICSKCKNENNKGEKYTPIFLSSNAITLTNKVQLIIRFYGDPEEIHKNYDFVHCTNYWTSYDNKLVLRKEALESILTKTLTYMGSKYPVCSIIRMRKFIKRGWRINAGQILKMIFQASDLNLKNIAVLEDQLVGVDSAYFMQLITAIENKMKEEKDFEINTGYICSVVDKIFG